MPIKELNEKSSKEKNAIEIQVGSEYRQIRIADILKMSPKQISFH
jgi:DNA-binding CsgD family transcriptional regulator